MVDTTSSTISEHGASNPAIDKSHFEEIDTASTTPTPSEVNEPQLETDVPQNSKPKQVTFYDKTVGRFAGLLGFSKRYNAILCEFFLQCLCFTGTSY